MTANKPVVIASNEKRPKPAAEEQSAATRQPITCDALQSVIAKAVRDSSPECAAFVGVVLEKTTAKSPGNVNWAIRGIKYGKGDRAQCDAAISDIVEQLQREFYILTEPK